jgi:hypothetical protein
MSSEITRLFLVEIDGKLHIKVVADPRYDNNAVIDMIVNLDVVPEDSEEPLASAVTRVKTPPDGYMFHDVSHWEFPASTVPTRYMLSYTLDGVEYRDFYPRDAADVVVENVDVEKVKTTLRNLMLTPGWKATKRNNSTGWTTTSIESAIMNLPSGSNFWFKAKRNIDGFFSGSGSKVSGAKLQELFLPGKQYSGKILGNGSVSFSHESKLTVTNSVKTKALFLANLKCKKRKYKGGLFSDDYWHGNLASGENVRDHLIHFNQSYVQVPGGSKVTFDDYLGGQSKWMPYDRVETNAVSWQLSNSMIGFGHQIKTDEELALAQNGYTQAEALTFLEADVSTAVDDAQELMGDCWIGLQFWACVAWSELVFNVGKERANTAKYADFKQSLVTRNYGTLENPQAGTSCATFHRDFTGPSGSAPCTNAHAFIKKLILAPLCAFGSEQSTGSDVDSSSVFEECTISDVYNDISPDAIVFTCESDTCAEDALPDIETTLKSEVEVVSDFCAYNMVVKNGEEDVYNFDILIEAPEDGECTCPSSAVQDVSFDKEFCRGDDVIIECQFDGGVYVHYMEGITDPMTTYRITKKSV